MVTINLLPWREYTRHYQKQMMKKILLRSMLAMLLILAGIHVFLSKQQANSHIRIDILQKQLDHYQMQSVERKPASRADKPLLKPPFPISTLFFELGKMSKEPVCFTDIVQNNQATLFIGNTHSAADLTHYLKNWQAAHLFSQININQLDHAQFRFQAS